MQTIKKHIIILTTILLWLCVSVFAGEVREIHFLKDSYASGERTVKSSGENAAMFVNAEFAGGMTNTAKFSLYVSPYLVANQGGRYTKHIYIGSQRIVSKLGDLKSYGADPRRIEYAGSESDGPKVDYKTKYALQQQVIKDNFAHFDVPYNGADNNDYVDGKGFSETDGSLEGAMLKAAMAKEGNKSAGLKDNFQQGDSYEQYQYFYHPDHLGSSSFITNTEGEVVQHIEYVPYGEVFIEERNNVWNTPYLFNAKEFDEETGLYYYGARYYDSRLAMWYGVDALAEKYPNISPYNYCVGNPVKFVDPDGNDAHWVEGEDGFVHWDEDAVSESTTKSGDKYLGQEGWEINEENGNIIHYENDGTSTESSVGLGDVTISGNKSISLVRQAIYKGHTDFLTHPVTQAALNVMLFVATGGIEGFVSLGNMIRVRSMSSLTTNGYRGLTNYYPPNGGFLGSPKSTYLMPGEIITRYGRVSGRYFSPQGTPLYMRALPPDANIQIFNTYQVLKPIPAESGLIAPAFGKIGLGTQYLTPVSADVLLKRGFLKRVVK